MTEIKRVDFNQKEVVNCLKKIEGISVQHLHTIGKGCPDILVGYAGHNYLYEIKSDGGTLTPSEEVFFRTWKGHVKVVFSADEIIADIEGKTGIRLVVKPS